MNSFYLSLLTLRRDRGGKVKANKGFSLIELVVVIAVLAILIAIALPNFLGVQRDARVSSVKNNLANLIKECGIKESRGNPATMGTGTSLDIASAKTKINGYEMVPYTVVPTAAAYPGTILGDNTTSAGVNCYAAASRPLSTETANFLTYTIEYNRATGQVVKRCNGPATAYKEGCFVQENLTGGPIPGGSTAGYW